MPFVWKGLLEIMFPFAKSQHRPYTKLYSFYLINVHKLKKDAPLWFVSIFLSKISLKKTDAS